MMFGSFYAAMQKHQRDFQEKEEQERKRKREGKITIEKIKPEKLSKHDDDDYTDYEEVKWICLERNNNQALFIITYSFF